MSARACSVACFRLLLAALFGLFAVCLAASDSGKSTKSSSSSSSPVDKRAKMSVDWSSLAVVDWLRAGALLVAFVGVLCLDMGAKTSRTTNRRQNYLLNTQIISFFVLGLAYYFFPENIWAYWTSAKVSRTHLIDSHSEGSLLIAVAVFLAKSQPTIESDGLIHNAWLLSSLIGTASLFGILLLSQFSLEIFTAQHLVSRVMAVALMLLGCLFSLWRGIPVGGSGVSKASVTSGINRYLLIDLIFMFPLTVMALAYPDVSFKMYTTLPIDTLNFHIHQTICMTMFSWFLFMITAFFSDSDDVKQNYFFSRLLNIITVLPVIVLYQLKEPIMTYNGCVAAAVMMFLQFSYCFLGYNCSAAKTKTR